MTDLPFECARCGACCGPGPEWGPYPGAGYTAIIFRDEEKARIADFLGMSVAELEQRFDIKGNHFVNTARACPFLYQLSDGTTECVVHPVRPINCASFPQWRACQKNPEYWAQFCPGIQLTPEGSVSDSPSCPDPGAKEQER